MTADVGGRVISFVLWLYKDTILTCAVPKLYQCIMPNFCRHSWLSFSSKCVPSDAG